MLVIPLATIEADCENERNQSSPIQAGIDYTIKGTEIRLAFTRGMAMRGSYVYYAGSIPQKMR